MQSLIHPNLHPIQPYLSPPFFNLINFYHQPAILDLDHLVESFSPLQPSSHIGPLPIVLHGNHPAMPALYWGSQSESRNRNPSTRRCRLVLPSPIPLPTRITIAVLASLLVRQN